MSETAIPGWAWKVLAKIDVSLKQAAWAFGCAKKGSEEERLLLERFWVVVERNRASQEAPSASVSESLLEARKLLGAYRQEHDNLVAMDSYARIWLGNGNAAGGCHCIRCAPVRVFFGERSDRERSSPPAPDSSAGPSDNPMKEGTK